MPMRHGSSRFFFATGGGGQDQRTFPNLGIFRRAPPARNIRSSSLFVFFQIFQCLYKIFEKRICVVWEVPETDSACSTCP